MRNASPKRAPDGREQEELHMQSKRFYWLKLQEHFFQDKAVKKLRQMPNGDTCVMIYLKMLLLSLSSSGELYFDGLEPDFHTELALTLDEDEELVRDTLEFLMRVHRLEQKSETVYYLPEVGAVTGSESASAERMRKARQKPADVKPQEPVQAPAEACDTEAAHCDTPAAHCDVEKEIEKELEIEKETESDAEKELFPESQTAAAAVPETTTTTGSRKKGLLFPDRHWRRYGTTAYIGAARYRQNSFTTTTKPTAGTSESTRCVTGKRLCGHGNATKNRPVRTNPSLRCVKMQRLMRHLSIT
ncbi:phage replisome organizer N-terminal domain-containing protein [uncultured Ruminococcus sp.]|uniref:phage replisome organizer N-terminal domain-containing protein n=1 Tax=uncultured Ruminococcus sp. TaxID=165186 RepID=UPI002665A56D|nr:phage replisome organizer N-terminal domain-containing protein [uncultured Ruminococcus sp.]